MTSKDLPQATARDLSDEHSHLRQLVQEIRRTFARGGESQPEVLATLKHLNDVVLEHFQHEEAGGYFREAIEVAPRLKDQADGLLRQHPDLAKQLERLLSTATTGSPSASWWQAIAGEYDVFARTFDAHEQAENSLIQEAYTRDIGTDD
jgi:hypothetical protein